MSICATVFGAVSTCDIRDEECLKRHGVYTQPQPGYPIFIIDDAHLTAIAADSARRAVGR